MIGIEVEINGEKVCTVGTSGFDFLSAMLMWMDDRPWEFQVRGMSVSEGVREHLKWLDRELKMGDQITIRFVEVAQSDTPGERSLADPRPDA